VNAFLPQNFATQTSRLFWIAVSPATPTAAAIEYTDYDMKPTLPLLALALTAATLTAQTPAKPAVAVHHAAAPTHTDLGGCAKPPALSPKIPALPVGTPCARSLFVFTTSPSIKLDYVSPLVTPEVRESLGLSPNTFSLDYSEVKVGAGPLAEPKKYYTVQYTGYLLDGTQFDTSVGKPEPFTFQVGAHRVIPGWDLGTQGMHIGGKRRLYIPWQLGYGERGNPQGNIPPKAELVFDIELVSQSDNPPAPPTPPTPPPAPRGATTTPPPAKPTPTTTPPATPPAATTTPK